MNQKEILDVLKKLAVEAGDIILEVYGTDFAVDYKKDDSPLTLADRRANEHIVQGLREHFPEYAILSEEMKDDGSRRANDYCFIVDPLDGTKEFVKRNGQFTVNIALAYQQHPIIGVIMVPVTGDLYYAATGNGAYKQDGKTGEISKLQVSTKMDGLI